MSRYIDRSELNMSWASEGNCRGLPVDLFFLSRGSPISPTVKEACGTCPVQEQCLQHAIQYERYGIWAGTNEDQRQKLRRSKGIKLKEVK
jgi:WhiB family redox-sensing transcriptional regulator